MRQVAPVRPEGAAWKAVFAALLALLVGLGLSRFAFSPLIPAVVAAGWFSPSDAAYLGAANLVGYLIGALGGRRLASWSSPSTALRALMLSAAVAFVASAFPLSFGWFFLWRLVSGIAGGALMVLAPTTVLAHVAADRRGLAAGVIFAGVGLGIILSGTLVPALLGHGLPATWFGLAAVSLAATGLAWFWWPVARPSGVAAAPAPGPAMADDARDLRRPGLVAVYASYGLIAFGLFPHMVFLVDFVARGLGHGIDAGGRYWVVFGLGALLGPVVAGRLADRFGFGPALRGILVLHIAAAAVLVFDHSAVALLASSLLVGSAVTGTVPLVLGQTQERVLSPDAQKTAWSVATATFALGQAAGGYACSYLFARTGGNFEVLFFLGAAALFLALATNLAAALAPVTRPGKLRDRGP